MAKNLCHQVITGYHWVPKFQQYQAFSVLWWCVCVYLSRLIPSPFGTSGLVGKVDFTVRHLSSSVQTFPNSFSGFSSGQPCFSPLTRQVSHWNMKLPFSLSMTFSLFLLSLCFRRMSTSLWLHQFVSILSSLLPHFIQQLGLEICWLVATDLCLVFSVCGFYCTG